MKHRFTETRLVKTATFIALGAALASSCLTSFAASTVRFSAASNRVVENVGEVLLSVVRLGDLDTVVSVDYFTTDITAKAGEDYAAAAGTVTFDAGQTNQTVRIVILNDGLREAPASESFSLTLTNVSPNATLGVPAIATVFVQDNDPGIQVEFPQYWAREETGEVVVSVVRGPDENMPATVNYATTPQTASAGADFTPASGTLIFAATEKLKLINIPVLNDGLKEADETFRLVLTDAFGDLLGARASATITITDNDGGIEFEVNQVWVHEDQGGVGLNVVRGNDQLLESFTVSYAVTNLTASPDDHEAANGALEFAAGESRKTIWIPVRNDKALEPDEKLQIHLSNPSPGATLGRTANLVCTVTICDATGLEPRRFEGIRALASGAIQLDLSGGFPKRFGQYFSLFHLESSPDLLRWQSLALLGHLNGSANQPAFIDGQTSSSSQRFYRVASSFLITPSRPPSGPHRVGKLTRLLTDTSRRNRYRVSTNGSFVLTVWYPAMPKPGQLPAPYEDERIAQDVAWQTPAFMDRAPRFSSYAFADAPVEMQSGGYPVILHSHGNGAIRTDNQELAENLASHGYVVAAVDHWDTSITAFPDGRFFRATDISQTVSGLQDRVADLAFVADELRRMNQTDSVLAGNLDLGRLAAMGWSWGAMTAGEFCRVDNRCRAAVTLDWAGDESTVAELMRLGLPKPLLMLNRSDNNRQTLFDKAIQDAWWLQISDTVHGEFSTFGWFAKPNSLPQTREAARTIHAHALSFFNRFLNGEDDHLLDERSANYPRVQNFKRK
jgi:dienelactone hydrolase